MTNTPATPKMTRAQAKLFWKMLPEKQRAEFNRLMMQLENKELVLSYVGVDDNEQIQTVVFDQKDKPSVPIEPFMGHFKYKDDSNEVV